MNTLTIEQQLARQYTYEEVAKEIGVTKSAARKIEQRALRKLKRALALKGIGKDDLL